MEHVINLIPSMIIFIILVISCVKTWEQIDRNEVDIHFNKADIKSLKKKLDDISQTVKNIEAQGKDV